MLRSNLTLLLLLLLVLAVVGPTSANRDERFSGVVDGSRYAVQIPASWNGTLLLFSHGYTGWGNRNPAVVAPDPVTASALLDRGYALAGAAYSAQGWAVAQALPEQLALIALVRTRWHPRRILLWGESMGGLITTLLAQDPSSHALGALSLCGVVGGTTLQFDRWLTGAVAFQQLVAGADPRLRVVDISQPGPELDVARSYLAQAQRTPAGRARVALAASLAGVPGWVRGEPPLTPSAAEQAQATWLDSLVLFFEFDARAELEQRAGGNGSSMSGTDATAVLADSPDSAEVRALYEAAHLSVGADLARLGGVPPIAAAPAAAQYLQRYGTPPGRLRVPVLTVQTIGDGLISPSDSRVYAQRVAAAGEGQRLRELYVERAGHCAFSAGEIATSIQALDQRVRTDRWPALTPAVLNARAATGATLRQAPAFNAYQPPPSAY
ncbi:MAG: alpha/beta hydrolase [Candidatus Dormiibacterota bacterium]